MWGGYSPIDTLVARVSTAWSCIDLNATVLATMPPYIVKSTVPQDPLPWITNPEPEIYASWEEFAKQLFTFFQLGEAFVWATSPLCQRLSAALRVPALGLGAGRVP